MKILAIDLSQGDNRDIYWGKSKKRKKEWNALREDPKNLYDPLEFYRKHNGKRPSGFELDVVGEPSTFEEALIARIYRNGPDVPYERVCDHFPEDLCEERCGFDSMKNYADEMRWFISGLYDFIK